jgi:hypothetical protein
LTELQTQKETIVVFPANITHVQRVALRKTVKQAGYERKATEGGKPKRTIRLFVQPSTIAERYEELLHVKCPLDPIEIWTLEGSGDISMFREKIYGFFGEKVTVSEATEDIKTLFFK